MEEQQELIDLSDYPKTKVCTICGIRLTHDNFDSTTANKDGRHSWCKKCKKKYYKKWNNGYYMQHKREIANRHVVKTYGITIDDKEQMLIDQNYKCAICEKPLPLLGHDSHIDHNHETGEIRGLLCNDCNNMLGNAKDDVNLLKRAIQYLSER